MINDVHHEGGPKELEPMHDVRSRHAEVNQLHDLVKKQHSKIEKLAFFLTDVMPRQNVSYVIIIVLQQSLQTNAFD